MNAWGYVFLAYGIVWFVLLLYFFLLKRRVRKVGAELSVVTGPRDGGKNA